MVIGYSLGAVCAFGRKRLQSIGTKVSDMTAETKIDKDTTTANSLNSKPMGPGIKKIGINTATKEIEIEMIVKLTSRLPFRAALKGPYLLQYVA